MLGTLYTCIYKKLPVKECSPFFSRRPETPDRPDDGVHGGESITLRVQGSRR